MTDLVDNLWIGFYSGVFILLSCISSENVNKEIFKKKSLIAWGEHIAPPSPKNVSPCDSLVILPHKQVAVSHDLSV